MQAHPRIRFVATNTGERRAALLCGPQVWTVAESWLQHPAEERSPQALAETLDLPAVDVEAALSYWAEYRDEVDRVIEIHEADQDAALRAWQQRRALGAL